MTLSASASETIEASEPQTPLETAMSDLRRGQKVDDSIFDAVYPPWIRRFSQHFWTPVEVALRATSLLGVGSATRVLDVGSGVGKFCIVGAAATGGRFTGLEHRATLVEAGRAAVAKTASARVELVLGTVDDVPWETFDAFYLYNPFEENLWEDPAERIDSTIELSQDRFCRDVRAVERGLERARRGARVATYHGFGGRLRSFRPVVEEPCGTGLLRIWEKTR